ncbi:PA0069 family radical SAM protein [Opitutus terrae]|uniref:Radical SAM domain protein n=1 Tax=Opitutus terrae (strain DSM 11246 / JCM 15787 / PB90-1) TaxID=452637 RepID=B1ZS28_OPITP|nr:PA0069 family radical SAM protein [Opitutus terrae]ACB74704.1 Radical SAM domain protein [Opitutus terrae PB90-1]
MNTCGATPPIGRGANINPPNRFESQHLSLDPADAEWCDCPPEERPNPRTQFFFDASESLLTRNQSPDVGFEYGLNPYRGCEHGCAYCFARPFHEYLGWSSGLDFETKILVKLRAPELLRRELGAPRWQPQLIAMSGVTDCYQPAERHFRLSRHCLEVCAELRHPISIITKNALVTRDLDVLRELARWHCVRVNFSVTTLDSTLAGKLEPRASRPPARLNAIRELSAAGIPVGVMVAPTIPGLTDHELPGILAAAAAAGARQAGYIVLRLPYSVKDVFLRWLDDHEPDKKARVVERLRALRGGSLYDSDWAQRWSGQGIWAEHLRRVFEIACRRHGLNDESPALSTEHFRRPGGNQLELF